MVLNDFETPRSFCPVWHGAPQNLSVWDTQRARLLAGLGCGCWAGGWVHYL